jgi:hypothetical protein
MLINQREMGRVGKNNVKHIAELCSLMQPYAGLCTQFLIWVFQQHLQI